MIKRVIVLAFISVLVPFAIFAQQNRQEIDSVRSQLANEHSMGNLENVVKLAEKIAELEKPGGNANISNYTFALIDLAQWKRRWIDHLLANRRRYKPDEFNKYLSVEKQQLESLLRSTKSLLENEGNETLKLASVKSELGDFLWRFSNREKYRKEIESLFTESLITFEQKSGADSVPVISVLNKLTEFYYFSGDFEAYLPTAERYISLIREKRENNRKALTEALIAYSTVLEMTDRKDVAKQAISEVAELSGIAVKEPPKVSLILRRATSKIDLKIGPVIEKSSDPGPDPIISGAYIEIWRDAWGTSYMTPFMPEIEAAGTPKDPDIGPGSILNLHWSMLTKISVYFLIDESGNVIDVAPTTDNERARRKVIERVMKWKFRPFIYNGKPGKMRGAVIVKYLR